MAGKYDHIDFKPPKGVADAAARGLEWRKKNKGKGGLSNQQAKSEGVGSGVQRAVNLKNRDTLSPSTVRRMKAFFSRHEKNKKVEKGKQPWEDKGRVAWELWGGNPGYSWAKKVVRQMEAADKKKKSNIINHIVKIANDLDKAGEYNMADDIDELLKTANWKDWLGNVWHGVSNIVNDLKCECDCEKCSNDKHCFNEETGCDVNSGFEDENAVAGVRG